MQGELFENGVKRMARRRAERIDPNARTYLLPKKKINWDERFSEWRRENPDAWRRICTEALRLAAVKKRFSVKRIFEALRDSADFNRTEKFKLNNSYTAPAARALIALYPELERKIETRRTRTERVADLSGVVK